MNDTSPKVRKAETQDFEEIQQIRPSLSKESFTSHLEQQEVGDEEFLVVDENGELRCFVVLKWRGKATHPEYPDLEDLYTKESVRNKGYATTLLKECESKVKEKGFTKLGMACSTDPNSPARMLYAKLGYVHDGKSKYVDGIYNGVEDWCIDLEKSI